MHRSRLTPTQLHDARQAWTAWVTEHVRPAPEQVPVAVEAALEALQRGGSRSSAGFAARQRLGRLTRTDLQQVQQELLRVQAAGQELESLAPWELAAAPARRLKELFDARAQVLQSISDGGFAAPGSPAPQPAPVPAPAAAAPAAVAGPSLREFLADRSILLVSYTGAFLLVVATVLFEVYGLKGQGELRFGGVLALDLVFAAAGWACWRVPYLRVVGRTYVALAALMLPLVFAAAYVFLALHDRGLSVDGALAIAGPSCCLLYGLLAVRLRSQGYGVLAMLALPAGWYGLLQVLGLHAWLGPGLAPLAAVYAWLAYGSSRVGALGQTFAGTAELFLHAAALASVLVTAVQFDFGLGQAAWRRPALALAVIAAAYAAPGAAVPARRPAGSGSLGGRSGRRINHRAGTRRRRDRARPDDDKCICRR